METFKLKKLSLRNFKGIRELVIDDFKDETNIYGDNGTGKTTIFDAVMYLLFGKDSLGSAKFQVKTLDLNNNVIPKLEHEVSGVFEVRGKVIEIRRVLKEKWVKKRGALLPEFVGNESLFYWDDVPKQAKEYQAKINEILDEGVFKLITNPLYFNSLKWQDRREVLIRIAGSLTDNEVAEGNQEFVKLITGLQDKTIEEYKKELASKKKKLNVDLRAIPTRVDEATRGLPQPAAFDNVRSCVEKWEIELKEIDALLLDKHKVLERHQEEKSNLSKDIHAAKTKMDTLEFLEKENILEIERKRGSALKKIEFDFILKTETSERLTLFIDSLKGRIEALVSEKNKLGEKWEMENAKSFVFDKTRNSCPSCKREFEGEDLESVNTLREQMTSNFNANKTRELEQINTEGQDVVRNFEKARLNLEEKETALIALKKEALVLEEKSKEEAERIALSEEGSSLALALSNNIEYLDLINKLEVLQSKNIIPIAVDDTELLEEKTKLSAEIKEASETLFDEGVIKKINQRIVLLKSEEGQLSQQISDLELTEFTVELFIKTKIEALENKINQKFSYVKFKLFETQINGGEIECCEALVNGVSFSDLNNAAKINAGLDIINTLTEFHKVSAPIFIDNRESINDLIKTQSQLVNLIVSKDDKLRVA
ncbi:ATP-binding protein [Flavicella sp.]|uniref:ATP-binding protein n=1 Tax=Flavicella sp. TaxID=2957742 RepID=UPI00301AE67C